ncbi:MAG TPA: SulP family inorganic anion transporter [Sphingobium sp.]|uniref:SulP family inorganic anion transporter n=1 Tax=Sphingobium sp. TaxID=1912891 RepID=UPI002ED46B79
MGRGRDIIAGLSIAGLMLPEAVAYAGIAGLPPQRAILAAIAGSLAYLLIGRSRFAITSATSSSAAILAAALATFPAAHGTQPAMATLLVAMVGLIFGVAAVARLGGLASFISRPVLRGFAFGLAITIIIKQLPVIVGLSFPAANVAELLLAIVQAMGRWHGASVATGLIALAALLALRRVPALPGAFLVLIGGIGASMLFDLPARGVATVGMIDLMPHWDGLVLPDWRQASRLVQLAVPLVLILFAESWGTMRGLALRHGDTVEPNREMGALGLANIASAVVQGMPVGAGFSAGSAAEAAGAATRWTGLFAAMGLAALVLLAMPLVARLPQPVLAAVVVAALVHALDPAPLVRLWRIRRDLMVALGAAVGVLVLGVLNGMLFAILLSLGVLIRRLATPHFTLLGRLGEGHDYVDLARHPEAICPPGMVIVRPAEPLFFANAERILARVAEYQAGHRQIRSIVLSLEESFDLDSTALDALLEFETLMETRKVQLRLARVRDHVRDLLRDAGATALAEQSNYSVDDAVTALSKENR